MHRWGDDFDFAAVSYAARDIARFCKRWGRIGVRDYKEKYGTARVYCGFGYTSFHGLIWPGHMFCRFPFGVSRLGWKLNGTWIGKKLGHILWVADLRLSEVLLRNKFVEPLLIKYQIWIYKKAYERALKKYPHIVREILCGADYPEFLKHLEIHSMVRLLLEMEEECPY